MSEAEAQPAQAQRGDVQGADVRVVCHRTLSDPGLRQAWAALEQTGTATPFQTLAFADRLTRHVMPEFGASPVIFQVFDAQDRVLLILPMLLRQRWGVRRVESFDLDLADYVMPLISREFSENNIDFAMIWRLILAQLPPADIIQLKKVPQAFDAVANPLAGLRDVLPMGISTHPMPVERPEDIKIFRDSGLYADFRKRQRKALRDGHRIEVEVAATPDQAEMFFRHLAAVRKERFVRLKRSDGLQNDAVFRFYLESARSGAIDGSVALLALKIDGQIAAVNYGFIHARRCVVVMVGADTEKWSSFSPGLVNFVNMADWTISQKLSVYDLGVGDLTYKKRFRSLPCPMFEWSRALTFRGRIYTLFRAAMRFSRLFLERYPKLNLWVRQIRGR